MYSLDVEALDLCSNNRPLFRQSTIYLSSVGVEAKGKQEG